MMAKAGSSLESNWLLKLGGFVVQLAMTAVFVLGAVGKSSSLTGNGTTRSSDHTTTPRREDYRP
ncbi:MAG: hypothetical protein JWQ43_177 [Glaciihabitans sp.]|nr:hypothetical protein [Glaciihabitans sp.]